jgi:hypothetical protein
VKAKAWDKDAREKAKTKIVVESILASRETIEAGH